MIVKMTIEHTIQPGQESQALKLVKEFHRRKSFQSMSPVESYVKSVKDDSQTNEVAEFLDRLESFSRLSRLSCCPAKIRIYLTPCA